MIISPCISICKTDPSTGYCYGCGRNNEEKKIWKQENTTDEWKIANLKIIKNRLTGWQLESFEESYTYKIENGISLFKKNSFMSSIFLLSLFGDIKKTIEHSTDDKSLNNFLI